MRTRKRSWFVAIVCALAASGYVAANHTTQTFQVDRAASHVTVEVGRSGVFGFAGHDHEVAVPNIEGTIVLDSADATRTTIMLKFDVTTMRVTGRGEPAEDVPEVQRVMLSEQVLDAPHHPTITFTSRSIALLEQMPDRFTARVEGDLMLRGVSRPVTGLVEVRVSADRLGATGEVTVRQTDFGIRPVTAGAGTVKVRDKVDVVFSIVGRR